jgi:hypothetical protein
MPTKFDHAVIFVSNLEEAIADFSDLGFEVTRGGSHGLTEAALLIFSNQTYIELLALKPVWYKPLIKLAVKLNFLQRQSEKKVTIYWRLIQWFSGESGPVDWCVRVNDLAATLALWKSQGIDILHSEAFSRERIDGEVIRWHLGGTKYPDLPILLEDTTPIDARVPLAGTASHSNGATELLEIQVRVTDKATAENMAKKFLLPKASPNHASDSPLTIGSVKISFGELPMAQKISLAVSYSGTHTLPLDLGKTHGAKITLIPCK